VSARTCPPPRRPPRARRSASPCAPLPQRSRPRPWLLATALSCACAGPPRFTPGVTKRADVLLALGEPVLALNADTLLVHAWSPSTVLLMIPARLLYRTEAGVLQRTDLAMPDTWPGPATRQIGLRHVVHEFDAEGVLLRSLP
jgi:hypothetical protein